MLKELTVEQFVSVLASREPVPGGGSAGCVSAAIGFALLLKSARFSGCHEEIEKTLAGYMARAVELIDEDAKSYSLVAGAFKLPKETKEQKETRKKAIAEALKCAADVPMRAAKLCADGATYALNSKITWNQNLVSDVLCGYEFLMNGFMTCSNNVATNESSLTRFGVTLDFESAYNSMLKDLECVRTEITSLRGKL